MTVDAKGSGLAKPTKSWLGLKFQLHWSTFTRKPGVYIALGYNF